MIVDADAPVFALPSFQRALKDRANASLVPLIGVSKNPTNRTTRIATEGGLAALLSRHDRQQLIETLAYTLDAAADAKTSNMEIAA